MATWRQLSDPWVWRQPSMVGSSQSRPKGEELQAAVPMARKIAKTERMRRIVVIVGLVVERGDFR